MCCSDVPGDCVFHEVFDGGYYGCTWGEGVRRMRKRVESEEVERNAAGPTFFCVQRQGWNQRENQKGCVELMTWDQPRMGMTIEDGMGVLASRRGGGGKNRNRNWQWNFQCPEFQRVGGCWLIELSSHVAHKVKYVCGDQRGPTRQCKQFESSSKVARQKSLCYWRRRSTRIGSPRLPYVL